MSTSEVIALANCVFAGLALAIAIWAKLTARSRKDIDDIRSREDGHETRLARIEASIEQMPRAESVHELRVDVARIEGSLAVIGERLKPVAQVTERLQDWLLENKR